MVASLLLLPEQAVKLPVAAPEHLTLVHRLLPSPAVNLVVINRMMVDKQSHLSVPEIRKFRQFRQFRLLRRRLQGCRDASSRVRPAPSNLVPTNISPGQHNFSLREQFQQLPAKCTGPIQSSVLEAFWP